MTNLAFYLPPLPSSCLLSCRRPRPPASCILMNRAAEPPRNQRTQRLANPENVVLRPALHDSQVLAASRTVRTIPEMSFHIAQLRRQRLSLLLADLVARVRCEKPESAQIAPLSDVLYAVDLLSADLVSETPEAALPALRANIRRKLWDVRLALEPLYPSEALRTSLEVARSSFLDNPGRVSSTDNANDNDEAVVRSEMYALMVENILLEELRSLRVLERHMNAAVVKVHPGQAEAALSLASDASALLGIDDYRVRGKMRLADAVAVVRDELLASKAVALGSEVTEAIDVLHNALVKSLETDLSVRRPAGQAMLLRPRMDDIPNFVVVNDIILRGGQPSSRGLDWLMNYGVTLVIDLRGSDRENQWEMPKCELFTRNGNGIGNGESEEEDTRGDGTSMVRFCNIPIEDFQTPSMQQVYEFIDLVDTIMGRGEVLFVHCKAGIGRTGTMIACWRIYHGSSADDALAKERLYTEGGGGLRQEKFVMEFAEFEKKRKEKAG